MTDTIDNLRKQAALAQYGSLSSAALAMVRVENPDNWPYLNIGKHYPTFDAADFDDSLKLEPVPFYYQATYNAMLEAVPRSFAYAGFVRNDGPYQVIPYRYGPTPFYLYAEPGERVEILLAAERDLYVSASPVQQSLIRVPDSQRSLVYLRLGHGNNYITVRQGSRQFNYFVAATTLGTILASFAKMAHDAAVVDLTALLDEIRTQMSSRLIEHVLPYISLFPASKTLRLIGLRSGLSALTLYSGTAAGVEKFLAALTGNTPYICNVEPSADIVDPIYVESYRVEHIYSRLGYVWLTHSGALRRWAFARFAVNMPQVYGLVGLTDRTASLEPAADSEQTCYFDQESLFFDDYLQRTCFDAFIDIESATLCNFAICAVLFAEHKSVDPCSRLGAHFLDCDEDLDQGVELDYEEDYDPMSAGWVDFPITEGHWDPWACMGENPAPVRIIEETQCCWYYGYPCVPLLAQLCQPDLVEHALIQDLVDTLQEA